MAVEILGRDALLGSSGTASALAPLNFAFNRSVDADNRIATWSRNL
jgi:hypothetical protein